MTRSLLLGAALVLAAVNSIGAAQVTRTSLEPQSARESAVEGAEETMRFVTYELYVDPAGAPLAAWQVRLEDPTGTAKLVGVEGGDDPSFGQPPFYDPKALQGGAVVLAAFDAEGAGPSSETLVARVHLAITGTQDPDFNLTTEVVASSNGPIQGATARLAR